MILSHHLTITDLRVTVTVVKFIRSILSMPINLKLTLKNEQTFLYVKRNPNWARKTHKIWLKLIHHKIFTGNDLFYETTSLLELPWCPPPGLYTLTVACVQGCQGKARDWKKKNTINEWSWRETKLLSENNQKQSVYYVTPAYENESSIFALLLI